MSTPSREPAPRVGGGETAAARVEKLYGLYAALVRSVCRGLLRDRDDVEDAVQQTFLSAHRALANGSSPREPAAWLVTIARNECLARVRARMREPLPVDAEEAAAGPDAHAAAVRRHETDELRTALAGLPAQQRNAILLRELRGLSYEEVATTLSVSTSAVESLLFRARRSLQFQLREALASLSPAGLGQLLRQLAGAGSAAPLAAKVAAVGLGAVVATGGAVVSTEVIGGGHAPAPVRAAEPVSASHAAAGAPTRPVNPGSIWAAALARPAHPTSLASGRNDAGHRSEVSDVREVATADSGGGDAASSGSREDSGSGGGQSGSGAPTGGTTDGSGGGGAQTEAGSGDGSTDTTTTSTTPTTTTSDGGGTTTTTGTDPGGGDTGTGD